MSVVLSLCRFRREVAGFLAQLVEHRTENPCVGSSSLPEATKRFRQNLKRFFYLYKERVYSSSNVLTAFLSRSDRISLTCAKLFTFSQTSIRYLEDSLR